MKVGKKEQSYIIRLLIFCIIIQMGVIIFLVSQVYYRRITSRPTKRFYVSTESVFKKLRVTDQNGEEHILTWPRKDKKTTVIVYMSSMCSACMKHYPILSDVSNIFSGENFEVVVLWEDSIPKNLPNSTILNFRISDNTAVASSIPFMCAVDNLGNVTLASDYNTRYLVQFFLKEQKHNNAGENFAEKAVSYLRRYQKTNKKLLVSFLTTQCKPCADSYEQLKKLENDSNYEILVIGDIQNNQILCKNDEYLYSEIFNITTYPKYLNIDNPNSWRLSDTLEID